MTAELPRFLSELLATPPRAGGGVHQWLFRVARQLHAHLPVLEIVRLLESALARCGRHVSRKEIEDAIKNSIGCAWQPNGNALFRQPVKEWPEPNLMRIEAICNEGHGLADLWEESSPRMEDGETHTEEITDSLFPKNPLLCVGDPYVKPDGKLAYRFDTKPRENWRGQLAQHSLIVPSPMSATTGTAKEGHQSKHTLDNTGPRRFLVVECDFSERDRGGKQETIYAPLIRKLARTGFEVADMCAAILFHLGQFGPLVLAVHSGGKSLHGWFFCAGVPEEKAPPLYALGGFAWCRSRNLDPLAICADAGRHARQRQTANGVLFQSASVGGATVSAAIVSPWDNVPDVETPATTPPPVARPLSALVRHVGEDPGELLRSRFLCRTASLLLCGPTGIGKSSLARQFLILWALAREAFGIVPVRPLKSLLIQAENDEDDEAEMRDGIFAGLNLSAEEIERAAANVFVVREDERTGLAFLFEVVRPLLAEQKPDLLAIDPALSYLGGESNSQKDVGGFLRNGLNPLLRQFNCGCLLVHHTNKPAKGKEKGEWQAGDFAYLGAGSAEWANWARGVLALRSLGSHEIFELRAGKRGSRLGWRDEASERAFAKHLAHSKEPGVICWHEAGAEEVPVSGRPKRFDPAELLSLLDNEGLTAGEWQKAAKTEYGISEGSFHRERRTLEKAGNVFKSKVSGKWEKGKKL